MDLIRRALGRRSSTTTPTPVASKPATPVRPKDELHAYWRGPDEANRPERYLEHVARSAFLVRFVEPHLAVEPTILEIGCNVGRNLAHLFEAGHRRLTGIEINDEALAMLRTTYPEMAAAATLINAPVEDVIRDFPDASMDLVFTMAVLEHIHPDSEWIFDEIVRITRGVVVTIEDEKGESWRHTPRDYEAVFEARGLRQISHERPGREHGFGPAFMARAFAVA
jgi:SAM-dependent methyltransferase